MTKYIIAIDQGTQSTKMSIFDLEGNEVEHVAESLRPLSVGAGGISEHPDDDLWTSLQSVSKKLMAKFKGNTDDILGIGVGSVRFDRVYIKADGNLAQPIVSWMDTRVGQPYPGDVPTTRWLAADTGYITQRLTGEHKDTAANYLGMWPLDVDNWRWSTNPDVLAYFSEYQDKLFDLVMPSAKLGKITTEAAAATGLPVGLPAFATANDKAVEALGAGLRGEKNILVSLGTYIASMMEGKKNYGTTLTDAFWSNMADEPHHYLYESGGIRRGMWTISWFKDLLGAGFEAEAQKAGKSGLDVLNEEAAKIKPGSDGLVVTMDFLAPLDRPYRRGAMLGFDDRHGRGHIFRALMEGIALTMHQRSKAMIDKLDRQPDRLIITGGGSNSDLFMQIFADVYGIPSVRNKINGAASLGAAINVAVGAGAYDSYDQAIDKMVKTDQVFEPNPENVKAYQEIEKRYQKIYEDLDPVFKNAKPM